MITEHTYLEELLKLGPIVPFLLHLSSIIVGMHLDVVWEIP
jgi:hypothetical protein